MKQMRPSDQPIARLARRAGRYRNDRLATGEPWPIARTHLIRRRVASQQATYRPHGLEVGGWAATSLIPDLSAGHADAGRQVFVRPTPFRPHARNRIGRLS